MTRDEWKGMFANFPLEEHNKLVLVLHNGCEISIDTVFRFDTHFIVARGRLSGTVDEARGFFVPYEQMVYVRYEKPMKLDELQAMFANQPESACESGTLAVATPTPLPTRTPTPLGLARPALASRTPTPLGLPRPILPSPTDPAAASRLLLERIKAARTTMAPRAGNPTQ